MKDVTKGLVFYKTPGGEVKVFDPNAKTKAQRTMVRKRILSFKGRVDEKSDSKLDKEFKTIWKRKEDSRNIGKIFPSKKERLRYRRGTENQIYADDPYMLTKSVKQEYIASKAKGANTYDISEIDDGKHQNEIETIRWLSKNIGGHIRSIKEDPKTNKITYPDFEWEGRGLWEIKSASSYDSISGQTRYALDKIYHLKGRKLDGIVLNISDKNKLNPSRIIDIVKGRLNMSSPAEIDVIIKYGDTLVDVLRIEYKK